MLSIQKPVPNLHKDEKIIIFLRKHWVAFLGTIVLSTIMLLIPIIGLITLWYIRPDILSAGNFLITVLVSIYIFSWMIFFIVSWIDWYFDVLIVTDRRILDIHQNRLFSREIDELELLHIEDSSSSLKGILGTFFNFGDVYIQTAGTARNFIIENLPRPIEVARKIMELYHKRLHTAGEAQKTIDIHEGLGSRISPEALGKENHPKESSEINQLREGEEIKIPPAAKNMMLVKFNIHRDRLDECLEILPSLKSPTVNQLADKDYVAVETVVEAEKIASLISNLKQRGAENIIESKIEVL